MPRRKRSLFTSLVGVVTDEDNMKSKVILKDIAEAPNLSILKDKFGISEEDTIVAYGDVIYTPKKGLSHDLIVHELVHCERQKYSKEGSDRWWELYMSDEAFRLQEELIAYQQQYKYCCKVYKDKNRRVEIAHAMASELSSSRYGKMVSYSDAFKKICG